MAQAVDGDGGNIGFVAQARQDAVDGGVVNWVWMMEYRLLRRQVFHQLRKLNHGLPINLDFAHRRAIFGGGKATFFLVIPCFVDLQGLVGKIKIGRCHRQGFGKAHAGFGHQ